MPRWAVWAGQLPALKTPSPFGGGIFTARHARLPFEVLTDNRLQPSDKLVYASLALEIRTSTTNIVSKSRSEIAADAGISQATVPRSLARLARAGHISTSITRLRNRTTFQLHSQVFKNRLPKLISMPKRIAQRGSP